MKNKTAEEFWEEEEKLLIDKLGVKITKEEKVYFAEEMWRFAEKYASQFRPDRERVIEILNNHQHPMAGHDWLMGIGRGDFESIADELLFPVESKDEQAKKDKIEYDSGEPIVKI